jgi:uncharacterized membrane protein
MSAIAMAAGFNERLPFPIVNIGLLEGWLSIGAGLTLVAAGARRRSMSGTALALTGVGLVLRGASRHYAVYAALNRRMPRPLVGPVAVDGDGAPYCATIRVRRPPRDVYRFWRRLENLPRVFSRLESVTELDQSTSRWVLRTRAGELVEWDAVITDDVPDRLIAWRSVNDALVRTSGTITFARAPGGGTDVMLSLRFLEPVEGAPDALTRWLGRVPLDQMRMDLKQLRIELEAGDD